MVAMSKYYIVEAIRKIAEDLDDPEKIGTKPKVVGPPLDRKKIIEMQQALINLSKAIDEKFNTKVNTGTKSQESAVGTTNFGNYIAQNYLRKAPDKGLESGSTAPATHMSSITESMSRIGNAAKELTPDGAWGPKTNRALHDAHAFAFAMLKLAKDFGLQTTAYDDGNLQKFIIRKEDTEYTIVEKQQQAPILTLHINAIIKMFEEVKRGVIDNPEHKPYIEGNQPLVSYKKILNKSTQDKKTDEFRNMLLKNPMMTNAIPVKVPVPGGAEGATLDGSIKYSDLINLESFKKWYTNGEGSVEFRKQPSITQSTLIDAIRKTIQEKMPAATANPAPAQTTPSTTPSPTGVA